MAFHERQKGPLYEWFRHQPEPILARQECGTRLQPWPTLDREAFHVPPSFAIDTFILPVLDEPGTNALDLFVNPRVAILGDRGALPMPTASSQERTTSPSWVSVIKGVAVPRTRRSFCNWNRLQDIICLGNFVKSSTNESVRWWLGGRDYRSTMDLSMMHGVVSGVQALMERFAASLHKGCGRYRRGRIWVGSAAIANRFQSVKDWAAGKSRGGALFALEKVMSEIEIEIVQDVRV